MRIAVFLTFLSSMCLTASAAVIGQIDTFTTGTENWIAPDPGNPNPPTTALGGPGGPTDQFLNLVASGGSGAGSRLTVLNPAQWTGSFLGFSEIAMDVKNFGPGDVYLRLLFEHMTAPFTPPVDLALTKDYIFVPAGQDWTHIVFPIDPNSLTALIGTTSGALANTTTMRIFNNINPAFGGPGNGPPAITVRFGVDNIQAVPEPGTITLLGAGLIGLLLHRRRKALN
jgi:hypothetical protein